MSVEKITYIDARKGALAGIEKGNLEIVLRVTAQAKSLAPVDFGVLKNSIMWRTYNQEGGNSEGPTLISQPGSKLSALVGTAVEYGIYQEFGTRRMKPQPFLRPAVAIEAEGQSASNVLKKIQAEQMRGPLAKGQKRETFR